MAKKLKKLPKAPKRTASNESKIGYLKRVSEIQKENQKIVSEKKKGEQLDKKIASVRTKRI